MTKQKDCNSKYISFIVGCLALSLSQAGNASIIYVFFEIN